MRRPGSQAAERGQHDLGLALAVRDAVLPKRRANVHHDGCASRITASDVHESTSQVGETQRRPASRGIKILSNRPPRTCGRAGVENFLTSALAEQCATAHFEEAADVTGAAAHRAVSHELAAALPTRPPSERESLPLSHPCVSLALEVSVPNLTVAASSEFRRLIVERRDEVLTAWVKEQLRESHAESLPAAELRALGDEFLTLIADPADSDSIFDANAAAWAPAREFLADLSRTRARQGFSPSETASFVFALKRPLFAMLRAEFADDAAQLGNEIWHATELLDQLGLLTMEEYQRGREEVIRRQQQE